MTLRTASVIYGIPSGTLSNKINNEHIKVASTPTWRAGGAVWSNRKHTWFYVRTRYIDPNIAIQSHCASSMCLSMCRFGFKMYVSQANRTLLLQGLGYIYIKCKRLSKAGRCYWVHPINQVRSTEGPWTLLIRRFWEEHRDKHASCMRVSKARVTLRR